MKVCVLTVLQCQIFNLFGIIQGIDCLSFCFLSDACLYDALSEQIFKILSVDSETPKLFALLHLVLIADKSHKCYWVMTHLYMFLHFLSIYLEFHLKMHHFLHGHFAKPFPGLAKKV